MSEPRTWRTRRYAAGDEHDLLALFNRAFGKDRSLEHWRWQFERNPYAPPTVVVARRETDGLLVGSHVVMPIALGVSGRRVLAAHTLDLVVHEDFRRQGIFETTAKECFEWCLERGMRAVIAFPNQQSYPGFVRTLGWSRILDPTRWDTRVGVSRALGESLPARALTWLPDRLWRAFALARSAGAATVRETWSDRVPDDADELWAACAPELRVTLWKDREYLAWRYDANPDHEFEYLALRDAGRLTALAVVHFASGRATVCDWIAPRAAGSASGAELVRSICRGAIRHGVDRVSFVGADDGYFGHALEGFRSRPAPESVLTGRGLEPGELDERVRNGSNWCVTYGDADYV
jgi:GNAT superfamily N-acetyltransferase